MNPSNDVVALPFYEEEWNFDKVPDSELFACCLWEYARESESLGFAGDAGWCDSRNRRMRAEYEKNPKLKSRDDKRADVLQRRMKFARFDYEAFCERFWRSEFAALDIYMSLRINLVSSAPTWLRLPKHFRQHFSKKQLSSYAMESLRPAYVGEVEKLWGANRTELDKIRATPRPENDDSEDAALWWPSHAIGSEKDADVLPDGEMTVAFRIDFARFTDNEIYEQFRLWLAANRPKRWKKPLRLFPVSKKRGRKEIEFRVALERLGLMRLLHFHSPEELRNEMPAAWAKYGRKKADFRREVRAASKCFRHLFPFLPPKEKPLSEIRRNVWLAPILKNMDEFERRRSADGS